MVCVLSADLGTVLVLVIIFERRTLFAAGISSAVLRKLYFAENHLDNIGPIKCLRFTEAKSKPKEWLLFSIYFEKRA